MHTRSTDLTDSFTEGRKDPMIDRSLCGAAFFVNWLEQPINLNWNSHSTLT